MDTVIGLYTHHAFWFWLALGAAFLAFEVHSASGWLLWPAGSAVVVAILTFWPAFTPGFAVLVFALLTIITTFAGRRFFKRTMPNGPDINDTSTHLLGHHGQAVTTFSRGLGRVLIQGKEWAAETDGAEPLQPGTRVEVVAIISGSRLKVRST